MATLAFDVPSSRRSNNAKAGAHTTVSVNSASISGYNNDRTIFVSQTLAGTLRVPPGTYEQSGFDGSGNRQYRLALE